jgi:hypothetical protein
LKPKPDTTPRTWSKSAGLAVAHFHHRAARELHRQVQPATENKKNTANKKVTSEMALKINACFMKGMSLRILKNSMMPAPLYSLSFSGGRN